MKNLNSPTPNSLALCLTEARSGKVVTVLWLPDEARFALADGGAVLVEAVTACD